MPKLSLTSAETYALRTALRDLRLLPEYSQLHLLIDPLRARIPNPGLVLGDVRSEISSEVFCEVEMAGREAVAVVVGLQELSKAPEREYARLRLLSGRLLERLVPKRVLAEDQ